MVFWISTRCKRIHVSQPMTPITCIAAPTTFNLVHDALSPVNYKASGSATLAA